MAETAKTTMSAIGDARRTQIVQAARTICLEKGFSKITISDIAEHVGMTRSLFYYYFQDKNQVADAVLDDVINEVIARLEEWNEHRETGNISKALDDVVRLTRSLIADEGGRSASVSSRMATPDCTSGSSTAQPTASPTTCAAPLCASSSSITGCRSPTSTRPSTR